jgi:nitrite reductase/ring-hydroxylating ferredoxin subunit
MHIFNNWDIVAKGWYVACPSHELTTGSVKSVALCGQRLVVFRGKDGLVRALAAYCPHLGTDLGLGQVEGNWIRCAFHHWAFDHTGHCQDIPCQRAIPAQAKLPAYATTERYGFIWVYPDRKAPSLVEFDELRGQALVTQPDRPFKRNCHHHICMMNGIDAQHLKTIHHLDIQMQLLVTESKAEDNIGQINFTMRGKFPSTTWRERLGQRILGDTYEYSMRYADGCIGLLTMMKNVRFIPPLYMIYAYRPHQGKTWIQPIYVTAKRHGLWGWLICQILLLCTRLAYYMLRDEDGKIYDNIQFQPKVLLPVDAPLAQYMAYVNRLSPSCWSNSPEPGTLANS